MKHKLIILLLIGLSSLSHSQKINDSNIDRTRFQDYYLVNKSNDTILVYGLISTINKLHDGFEVYDENGNTTNITVNPEYWDYLFFKNYDGKIVTLKSLPIKKALLSDYYYKNVFMHVALKNSDVDIQNGKMNFYSCEFNVRSSSSYRFASGVGEGDPDRAGRISYNYIKAFYFKDINGFHLIKTKSDFKHFPKVLGKDLYKKMKKSSKGEKQFLFDYFTKHNNSLNRLAFVQ